MLLDNLSICGVLILFVEKVSSGAEAVDCDESDGRVNGGHSGARKRSTGQAILMCCADSAMTVLHASSS